MQRLQVEAAESGEVSERTRQRVELALPDAVEQDGSFAEELRTAVAEAQQAAGPAVAAWWCGGYGWGVGDRHDRAAPAAPTLLRPFRHTCYPFYLAPHRPPGLVGLFNETDSTVDNLRASSSWTTRTSI
jgi:hypothetical protein